MLIPFARVKRAKSSRGLLQVFAYCGPPAVSLKRRNVNTPHAFYPHGGNHYYDFLNFVNADHAHANRCKRDKNDEDESDPIKNPREAFSSEM
jgi:hypothetical protein